MNCLLVKGQWWGVRGLKSQQFIGERMWKLSWAGVLGEELWAGQCRCPFTRSSHCPWEYSVTSNCVGHRLLEIHHAPFLKCQTTIYGWMLQTVFQRTQFKNLSSVVCQLLLNSREWRDDGKPALLTHSRNDLSTHTEMIAYKSELFVTTSLLYHRF